ncbi:MAG: peptidase M16 [Ignavibacteriae bacterium HGW-Ignavibacteriae-4]|jgi:predicted Zn-dependent peptidase|nr:MAG: peptidase M16 [Ignavibacteriae bacterium HGW-Ignavibacteriae-4]
MTKILRISTLLVFLSAVGLFAQANEIKFEQETLDNGLVVIYNLDRSAPVVSTVVHYKVGSKDENPEKTGFAHFFEHLMFESTAEIPRSSIDKYINQAGGTLNAHTSMDETVYKFTVPANQIKLPLWIEASRMRKLNVQTEGVETQRGVVKEERNVRVDNQPYGDLIERMAKKLWAGSGYEWPTIGYHEHLNKATIEDFQNFYNEYYQPNNACLVISGDFNVDEAKNYVKEYFGSIPRGKEIKRTVQNFSDLKGKVDVIIEDEKAQLPGIFEGFRGPKLGEDDYYAMSLLSSIMASGESSRLYQSLVNEKQLAVASQMIPFSLQYSGALIFVNIPNSANNVEATKKALNEELAKVVKNGVTQEELTKAKNIEEASSIMSNKNTLSKAMSIARYWAYYGEPGMINTEIDKYLKVSLDDIKRVAKKYLDTDNKIILTYMPVTAEK